jgi:hypothetical protein
MSVDIYINLISGFLALVGAYFAWLVYKSLRNWMILLLVIYGVFAGIVKLLITAHLLSIPCTPEETITSQFLIANYILFCWAMIGLWQSVRNIRKNKGIFKLNNKKKK